MLAKCMSCSLMSLAEYQDFGPFLPQWEIMRVRFQRACISFRIVLLLVDCQLLTVTMKEFNLIALSTKQLFYFLILSFKYTK